MKTFFYLATGFALAICTFFISGKLQMYLFAKDSQETSEIISPLPDTIRVTKTVTPSITATPSTKKLNMSKLDSIIQQQLENAPGDYGIVIKNLGNGARYYFNEHTRFDTASLYKLWVMATVYDKINSGDLEESDVLSRDIATLNRRFSIDPENAELTEGTITLSVNDALKRMITVSDNYSALLLTEKIRLSTVSNFLKLNGFNESKVGSASGIPTSTANDISLFLDKLYNNHLGNYENTAKMLDLLKAQQLNKKLPKYLPGDVVIAHKTGELFGFSHDAAIVYTPHGDYIIVVLTESATPKKTEEVIANISKAVFDFMTTDSDT